MNNLIAVTIGDIKGIGIKIYINLLKNNKIGNVVLFCNVRVILKYLKKEKIKININQINKNNNRYIKNKKFLNIYSFKVNSNIDNTIKSILYAYQECVLNNFIGVVTLPLRKDLISQKSNFNFSGHTEFLQKLDRKKYSNMILFHKKIIISTITTHIPISKVRSTILKKNYLFNKILSLNNTLKIDFNIKKPKIFISGLNPHSGENGQMGDEELILVKPVISKLKKIGINIFGPYSADSMLLNENANSVDCFVYLFHDQALIPFKYISKFSGVNYTGNLNIIRTSPDHGTAYNIKNIKNISSMSLQNCFKLTKRIYQNRIKNEKSKKITRSKFFN